MEATQLRLVVDIGSSGTKYQIAQISDGRVTQPLADGMAPLSILANTKQNNGQLTPAMQKQLVGVLKGFVQLATETHGVALKNIRIIATSGLRAATNQGEVVAAISQRLKLQVRVIEQEEEGRLGYLTGLSFFGTGRSCIVWDVGGGSSQLTASGHIATFNIGNNGFMDTWKALVGQELNPLKIVPQTLQAQANQLMKQITEQITPPSWLTPEPSAKLPVVGIGGKSSVFGTITIAMKNISWKALPPTGTLNEAFTKQGVWDHLKKAINSPSEFPFANFEHQDNVIPYLCGLYAMMDKLGIQQLQFGRTQGICAGVLVSEQYWGEVSEQAA